MLNENFIGKLSKLAHNLNSPIIRGVGNEKLSRISTNYVQQEGKNELLLRELSLDLSLQGCRNKVKEFMTDHPSPRLLV